MTKLIARAACLALGLITIPAAAGQTYPTRAFYLNQWGGVNSCVRDAGTDGEVAWCAGDLPPSSRYNPSKFDCANAEVDSEYKFCGKPFPRRAR